MLNKGDAETIRFCQLFGLIPKKKKCPTCKQGMSVAYKRGRASLSSVDSNRLFVAVECDSAVYEVRDRVESRICGLACRQSAHFARGLVHSLPGLRRSFESFRTHLFFLQRALCRLASFHTDSCQAARRSGKISSKGFEHELLSIAR
jgi:hypothetical protein